MRLPMWAEYRAGKSAKRSTGEVETLLHGKRPTGAQRMALAYAKKHAARLKPVVVDALVRAYPTLRKWDPRPKTMTAAKLRDWVELWELVVVRDAHEKIAYVGYVFACAWDPSGVVVVMHRDRPVRVGGLEALEQPVVDPARSTPEPKAPSAKDRRRVVAAARKRAKKNPRLPPADGQDVTVFLPAWAGFRAGPWSKLSNGECRIDMEGRGPVATKAYRRILDGASATQRILLGAIARSQPHIRPRDLKDHVELLVAHVQSKLTDTIAYVGYQFACDWEEEHGLGVLLHGNRVVDIGQADTAFLGWNADKDRVNQHSSREAGPLN